MLQLTPEFPGMLLIIFVKYIHVTEYIQCTVNLSHKI